MTETNSDRTYKRLKSLIKTVHTNPSIVNPLKKEDPLYKRLYGMLESFIQRLIEKQVKNGNFSSLDLKILQANANTTTLKVWTKSVTFGIIGSFIGALSQEIILVFVFTALGIYIPFFLLNQRFETRKFDLLNELPDFLDLVAVTFPSSNNIENTFEIVCSNLDNEISKEFNKAVNEIKLGRKKREVYHELTIRAGIPEVSTLISQINQAESFGTGLEEVLLSQSRTIRHAKKELAQKQGNKAKNFMYIPGMILLAVALGLIAFPFAVPLIESFGGGF